MPSPAPRTSSLRWLVSAAAAAALVVGPAAAATAAPPERLPANATPAEQTYQPAFDYDTDGCYPTPAIGVDGTLNPGLRPTGALNGSCRDASDLDNTNSYARAKCDHGWCGYVYALYFEKDQAIPGISLGGHRHDWEHVVVWVEGSAIRYVATSAHGSYAVHPASRVRFEGTHAKVVYHKDGVRTHAFRLGGPRDEPAENHKRTWHLPTLVGWDGFPAGLRERLSAHDFGSAHFGLKDGSFESNLAKAMPAGIPFDPYA